MASLPAHVRRFNAFVIALGAWEKLLESIATTYLYGKPWKWCQQIALAYMQKLLTKFMPKCFVIISPSTFVQVSTTYTYTDGSDRQTHTRAALHRKPLHTQFLPL